jgi:hypothetical protein
VTGICLRLWNAEAQLVEALRYKRKCRGFDSHWCLWNCSLTESLRPHNGPEFDSDSNRNEYQQYFWGVVGWVKWAVLRADILTTFMCRFSWNLGASTSWNPHGIYRAVKGLLVLEKIGSSSRCSFMAVSSILVSLLKLRINLCVISELWACEEQRHLSVHCQKDSLFLSKTISNL